MKVGIISALVLFSIMKIGDGLQCYQCPRVLGNVVCTDNVQGKLEECEEGVKACYLKTTSKKQPSIF